VRVSNFAFAADGQGGGEYFNSPSQGLYIQSPGGEGCFVAGVDLPVGSRIQWITFILRSGPASNPNSSLWRRHVARRTGALRLATSVRGSDTFEVTYDRITLGAAKRLVTSEYAYGIDVCLGADDRFYGARIKYTYTSAGS
jgi:hypothetical protein